MNTPLRRLGGISYWVIEDPEGIHDYVNTEIRKEWETDARSEHQDPKDDPWLQTLSNRNWSLGVTETARIKLNPYLMNYVDPQTGYDFRKRLAERGQELQQCIKLGAQVIWPLVVRKEDLQLMDGYCRFTALIAMNVSSTYTYTGVL